jgi:hypothetical protein
LLLESHLDKFTLYSHQRFNIQDVFFGVFEKVLFHGQQLLSVLSFSFHVIISHGDSKHHREEA